ncbi:MULTISPECIES: hypothetical protein [unclassified Exiguobacterium]|uniref:hypothetical protein n=1 Tax=unclassified Exiguobacterium TaxID=2644629 RepID=UPI00135A6D37|nr:MULTISPECIES: hypothetical protein [unclassified Exiguobacterium]
MSDKKRKTALSLRLSSLNDVEYGAIDHFHNKHKGSVRAYAQIILLINELAGDLDFSQPLEVAKFLQSLDGRPVHESLSAKKRADETSTTKNNHEKPHLDIDAL